jgi:hypothetical protein
MFVSVSLAIVDGLSDELKIDRQTTLHLKVLTSVMKESGVLSSVAGFTGKVRNCRGPYRLRKSPESG